MHIPSTLLLSSHNPHKAQEIEHLFRSHHLSISVTTLHDLGDDEEIEETGTTLRENAFIKAMEGYRRHGIPSFADDTGLEVDYLGGAPGVMTARYAGPDCRPSDNIRKLLSALNGIPMEKRTASFVTVIALVLSEEEVYYFEGRVKGLITEERHGEGGFGYDPVFMPLERGITFAEMPEEEKNKISHRGRATAELIDFLISRDERNISKKGQK